jgi:phosphate transport system substrate-binding protein
MTQAAAQTASGAGSTLAYPVIAEWVAAYHAATGRTVIYQPVGSTAGETEMRQGLVDFAVTDAPLVDAQLLRDGLSQFPLVMGAIVPVANLDGVAPGQLHLPSRVLADIYLGRITTWRDPVIAAANPGLALPDRAITVVYRSDGSGTSFNWTNYLSRASMTWRGQVGAGTKVAWPVGSGVRGTDGMAAAVARIKGAIGYIGYSAAKKAKLSYALADNGAGRFVPPDRQSYQATADAADWSKAPDFAVVLSDTDDADAYPLMVTSFALARASGATPAMAAFFHWVLENGQDQAARLDYLPLPPRLVHQVEANWATHGRFATGDALTNEAAAATPARNVVRASTTAGQ